MWARGRWVECLDPQLVVSGRNSDITNWSTSNGPDTNDPTFGNYVSAAYSTDGARTSLLTTTNADIHMGTNAGGDHDWLHITASAKT